MRLQHLKTAFIKAGIGLEIAEKPFVGNNPKIVQMDIVRGFEERVRYERIRIWEGDKDNRLQVVNIDPKLNQLILMVHEPQRKFTVTEHDWRTGKKVKTTHTTSSMKRHFLMGVDERQLFIATLPRGVTTVGDAHNALKTTELILAEGKVPGKTIRQGEWFFVHPTAKEMKALTKALHKKDLAVHKKADLPMAPGGKPHTADYYIQMPTGLGALELKHGFPAQSRGAIYVKGRVSHSDHATIKLGSWRRVIKNNEPSGTLNGRGLNWVD